MPEIDTTNKFLVSSNLGNDFKTIYILNPLISPLNVRDALNLAAWLVVISNDEALFYKTLNAIKNT